MGLVGRLLALVRRDEVAKTALRAEVSAATGTLDLAAFRKELTARPRISGYLDRRAAADCAGRVHGLLDSLEALIRAGLAADVVVLAEHVTGRLETAMGRLDDSPALRAAALERLRDLSGEARSSRRWYLSGGSEAVRAQREEGDVEGAWADAQRHGCEPGLWRRPADAGRESHPGDAVAVYGRLLDEVLERTDVRAHREGVALLREIRAALAARGREVEFASDVERIREAHGRRPKLMSLLAAEGW